MASTQAIGPNTRDEASTEVACNPDVEHVFPDREHEDEGSASAEPTAANVTAGDGVTRKKRKKNKPKSQRVAKAGSGFEEYYVDAPITPAEHDQERGLYHASLPFAQRIETAIQRFAAKRNMDTTKKHMFDKYLIHGGIEAGPKMFSGGLDPDALTTENKEDIALMTVTHFLPFDKTDPKNDTYVVDFEGCLRAFLSYNIPTTFDLTSQKYTTSLTGVIRNFLNYLLYHDACPEYQDQIQASKMLCDQGERELWAVAQNITDLPGDFNTACSELYGGIFQGQWVATSTWLIEEESAEPSQGIPPALARQIFKMGVVANASNEQFEKYESQSRSNSIRVNTVEDVSMEVIETVPSNADVQRLYASRGSLKPLGKLMTKTWHTPFAPAEDLTEAEEAALACAPKKGKFYVFWVEDDLLRNCYPGLKIDATVKELSIGVSYFDAIQGIYCSFFDISANQRMADWREPEGEGNWLPMRATGGGPLEESDEKADVNVPKSGDEETQGLSS